MNVYWIILICSALLCMAISCYRYRIYDIPKSKAIALGFLLVFYGCVGAKILYMLEHIGQPLTLGGMSFFGAIYFMPVGIFLSLKLMHIGILKGMDFVGTYGPLVIGLTRIGCYCSGCCGPKPLIIGTSVYYPPVQLIECVLDLCIFTYLIIREHNNSKPYGLQYPIFMICYSINRFILEYFRNNQIVLGNFTEAQIFSIATLILGAFIIKTIKNRSTHL